MNVSLVPYYSESLVVDQTVGYDVVFLIDVYRATSTMVVLTNKGAKEIRVAASLEEAFSAKRKEPSLILCGERESVKPKAFDYGNDTALLNDLDFNNQPCLMTTSNGTRALRAYSDSSKVFFACSVLNLNFCIEKIQQSQYKKILILCAGNWGQFSMEDYLCASLLIHGLRDKIKHMNDKIRLSVEVGEVYQDNLDKLRADLKKTDHAQRLKSQNKFDDVCFIVKNINAFNCLPRMQIE